METCLDTSTHCQYTSRHCHETPLMITLENDLERRKMIYNSYNDLERYVSVGY